MNTKILILAVLASIIFIACQKEDESKNPYNNTENTNDNTKQYFFNEEERSLFLYNETDSFRLLYDDYDTLQFKIMSIDIDTLTNSNSKKYEQAIVRFQRNLYGQDYEMGFIYLSKENGTLNYKLTLSTSYPATNQTITNKIAEKYNSVQIDSVIYYNVYRIEDEAVSSDDHICLIKRAYVSPEKGIIKLTENCHTYKIVE